MAVPAPVVAECYKWSDSDTVAVSSTTAATGFPVANVKDSNLMFSYRTADADNFSGFVVTLASAMDCYGFEVVNVETAAGEDILATIYSDNFTTTVAATSNRPTVPSEIWTGHTQLKDWQPTRPNWILGVDNLSTGPTPDATTPVPASVSAKTGSFTLRDAVVSRTYWEFGFLGLAINAKAVGALDQNSISAVQIPLRGGGTGFRWELRWPRLSMTDVVYLRSVAATTERGKWPFFLWPFPGQKTSAGGVITATRYSPATRGGLARFVSFEVTEQEEVGGVHYGTGCRLVAESWAESRE